MALNGRDDVTVTVWARRSAAVEQAKSALPGCRVTGSLADALRHCNLAVLCTSPQSIEAAGPDLVRLLPPEALVTDAGSVKQRIVTALESSLGGRFVGAHPMAGSEQSGLGAARADLFSGAACIVTQTPQTHSEALAAVQDFWRSIGCVVHTLSPEAHDQAIAKVSHLPHAVAAALVKAIASPDPAITALAGSGYRDTTRVAAGSPSLWTEILLDNREAVMGSINDLQVVLEELKTSLATGDRRSVEEFLTAACALRSAVPKNS
jgi:prephenate dehydrogenase